MEKVVRNNCCKNCTNKSCAILQLNTEQLELLSMNNNEVKFEKGETLFKQNSLTSHVIYVKSGLIKVHIKGPSGKDQIFKIAKSGAYLGIPSIIGDKINNYSATAISHVISCFIDIQTFKTLLLQNPQFTYRILENSCKEGLCNLHKFVNQSQKNLAGKLAEALLHFSDDIFCSDEFDLPISRKDLADLIGTTRESTISMLKEFKNDGFIMVQTKRIQILNMDKLRYIADYG